MGVEKIVSFADWSHDHPADRLPVDRLDSQFDNHANAIRELEQRIAKLLRADGKLNHGLLAADSIPQALFSDIVSHILEDAHAERRAAEKALEEIKFRQADIWRRLDDAKIFAQEASREFAHNLAIVNDVVAIQEDLNARLIPLAEQTAAVADGFSQQGNAVTLSADAAENWAEVSMEWAEHMPDTIPGNILATNAVTGDHWSSRWWANQAAAAVGGFLFHYYLGPLPDPPFTLPNGDPVQPGMIYFDTDSGQMYVWNGTAWVPFSTPQPAGTAALFYASAANQTVFPLATPDLYGKTVALDPAKSQGVEVFLNGVRLTPSAGGFAGGDYSVNLTTSTVTLAAPVSLNSILGVDVLKDPVDMTSIGAVTTVKLKTFVFDGVAVVFNLLTAADAAVSPTPSSATMLAIVVDGVTQEPGVDFTLTGAGTTVTFNEAPRADAKNFVIYFSPSGGTGGGGSTAWVDITGKPATFPPTLPIPESGVTNLVTDLAGKAPLASPVFTGDPQAPTPTTADNDTSVATTAFVKAQSYVTAAGAATAAPVQSVASKTGAVTLVKADVGLGNVDNTSDVNKPVSTATQTALNAKEPTIAAGTATLFWRGDKTWGTSFVQMTQAAYTALGTKDANTLYVIVG